MTDASWPSANARLESSYRRLLLAYPGAYRRRHGTEIVTTLLEMAGPGQSRPATSDAWHLFASGIRQRFRLPAGRPLAWMAAVLITLIAGAFGAAAGSWAAEQTFTALPSETAFAKLLGDVSGRTPGPHGIRGTSPWAADYVWGVAHITDWSAEPARQQLAAAGWRVGPPEVQDAPSPSGDASPPGPRVTSFRATRDGLAVTVTGFVKASGSSVTATVHSQGNGVMRLLVILGGILGLSSGWLLAAALSYRLHRRRDVRSRLTAVTAGLAVGMFALPAIAFYGNVIRVVRGDDWVGAPATVHSALNPDGIYPYFPYAPLWLPLGLTVAGAVLAVVAGILLMSRRPSLPMPAVAPAAR